MVISPALDVEKSLRTSSMESTKPSCRSGIALLAVLQSAIRRFFFCFSEEGHLIASQRCVDVWASSYARVEGLPSSRSVSHAALSQLRVLRTQLRRGLQVITRSSWCQWRNLIWGDARIVLGQAWLRRRCWLRIFSTCSSARKVFVWYLMP